MGLDPAQPVGSFVDAILTGQSVAPSFYEGWQTQRVIDAAFASHEQGEWVEG